MRAGMSVFAIFMIVLLLVRFKGLSTGSLTELQVSAQLYLQEECRKSTVSSVKRVDFEVDATVDACNGIAALFRLHFPDGIERIPELAEDPCRAN